VTVKLLLVNDICVTGGVEAAMALLAGKLVQRGHDVRAYCHSGGGGEHLFDGICPITVGLEPTLGEVVCNDSYDVIHANYRTIGIGLFRILKRVGYRGAVVITSHGDLFSGFPCARPGSAIVAVSDFTASRLEQVIGTRPITIYNAIDNDVFCVDGPLESASSPVLLWVGRYIDPDKDFPGFVAIATIAVANGWSVWMVDGCMDARHDTMHEWFGDRFRLFRRLSQSQIAGVYRGVAASGGCLVSTSQRESFGLAVAEAMACGCPVVAPRIDGLVEVVEDDKTGILYDRSVGAYGVWESVCRLLDAEKRQRLSSAGAISIADRFSPEVMAVQYEAVYSEAMKHARSNLVVRRYIMNAALRIRRLIRTHFRRVS
jgi:glycosyltransferase involved in cell wall biosynthesis